MKLTRANYELILNNFPRGLVVVDRDGVVIYANRKLKKIFGKNPEFFLGSNFHDLVHKHREASHCSLQLALSSLKPFTNRSDVFRLSSRKSFNIEYSTYPLIEGDVLEGYIIRIRRELVSERYTGKFVATLGHEFKTPLTVISSYTHLLKRAFRQNDSHEFNKYMQVVREKIELLTQLIQGMLDTVKLGTGKMRFSNEVIALDEEMEKIVNQMQETIPSHELCFLAKSQAQVKIDPKRLFQVVSNLITNAVKYSPNQDKVLIKTTNIDGAIQIEVQDFGQGINAKRAHRIFEPFYRTQEAKQHEDNGLGMGLFLTKQIVSHYHGKIWFDTELNEGTTFYINLPIKHA
jgi:PAS domain S-box-containing protein